MSRVGQKPVEIASGVDVSISDGKITVKGAKVTLTENIPPLVTVKKEGNTVVVTPNNDNDRESRSQWGLTRALINSMVIGVTKGFSKTLELNGVGYKVALQGKTLVLNLGFSHQVDFPVPEGIDIKAPKPTEVVISGANKQQVGQVAAVLRAMKKPEPYKGKGFKYSTETIRRKEGKKK